MLPRLQVQVLLGLAVKQNRVRADMTQEDLSRRSGLRPTYISDIERGARIPAGRRSQRSPSGSASHSGTSAKHTTGKRTWRPATPRLEPDRLRRNPGAQPEDTPREKRTALGRELQDTRRRAGEFCAHSADRQYRRYGFRCTKYYRNVQRYRLTHA